MAEPLSIAPTIHNPHGAAPILLICDHASNHIPSSYAGLGLSDDLLQDHVAWDIGALGLARKLGTALDAPLISAAASRLLIDTNRAGDAPDLVPALAEGASIPGNAALDQDELERRIAVFHAPFHAAIDALLGQRPAIQAVVSVHSFAPVLMGSVRPWHVGVLHDEDSRLADPLISALAAQDALTVGRNQPYAPADGVYYTLQRHAGQRVKAMIEVRNDLLRDEQGQDLWSGILAGALEQALSICAKKDANPRLGEDTN